jgi:hypothetical protein
MAVDLAVKLTGRRLLYGGAFATSGFVFEK